MTTHHCMYDICDEGADSKGGKSLTIRNSDDVEHQFATGRVSRLIQSRSASLCSAALSLKAAMIKIFIPPQCQKGWLVVKKKKIHRGSTPGSVALSCTFIVYSFQCNFIHICMWHMYHLDLFYHTCHVTFTLHVCDQASDCSWKLQFNWILLTVQIQPLQSTTAPRTFPGISWGNFQPYLWQRSQVFSSQNVTSSLP